ncbi:hypothetical protein G7Z17_g11892 [Cylindrodendrum hubeiense]|uniref:Uncharacterized protein n=1 Tax=Cylindrodendrum hubeiense TaxID=595255 RepID=A0A9P5GWL8_9HYPO|nr:hypothetical protein G7Z17_g11892 [Cylindrodendrum hubeiense]
MAASARGQQRQQRQNYASVRAWSPKQASGPTTTPGPRRGFPTGWIGFIGGWRSTCYDGRERGCLRCAGRLEEGHWPRQRWRGKAGVVREGERVHIMAASGTAERVRGGRASGVTRRRTVEE